MSASSACTRSCASTSARTACWRAAQPIAVPPAMRSLPANKGIEGLVFVPQGPPARRHADRDLRARARRGRQHHGVPDRRAEPRQRSRSSAATISTSAMRAAAGRRPAVLERSSAGPRGLAMRIRRVAARARSSPARWSTARCCSRPTSATRSTIWKAWRAPQRRRRHRAHADLRRQFLVRSSARCCCSSRWRSLDQK